MTLTPEQHRVINQLRAIHRDHPDIWALAVGFLEAPNLNGAVTRSRAPRRAIRRNPHISAAQRRRMSLAAKKRWKAAKKAGKNTIGGAE